jgi:hypothetical protein
MMKTNGKKIKFADNYVPGKFAVICGRGKACTASPGNRNLRSLVMSYLKHYSQARDRVEKSCIVSAIIASVRQASPDGAFVKKEAGVWWEVNDGFAREKIGCLLRDYLHTQYRSSTKAKLARKSRKRVTPSSFMNHRLDDSFHSMNNISHSRSSKQTNGGSNHSHSYTYMMMNGSNHSHPHKYMMMNGSNHSRSSYMTDATNAIPLEPLSAFPSGTDKFAQAGAPVKNLNNYYSLLSSCLNQQQRPPRHQEARPDFRQRYLHSMPIEGQGTSRNGCSSLLQDVCNVTGIGNEGDDDHIPDDISDIFEDDLGDPFVAF